MIIYNSTNNIKHIRIIGNRTNETTEQGNGYIEARADVLYVSHVLRARTEDTTRALAS
jgi:hypothetical protein